MCSLGHNLTFASSQKQALRGNLLPSKSAALQLLQRPPKQSKSRARQRERHPEGKGCSVQHGWMFFWVILGYRMSDGNSKNAIMMDLIWFDVYLEIASSRCLQDVFTDLFSILLSVCSLSNSRVAKFQRSQSTDSGVGACEVSRCGTILGDMTRG